MCIRDRLGYLLGYLYRADRFGQMHHHAHAHSHFNDLWFRQTLLLGFPEDPRYPAAPLLDQIQFTEHTGDDAVSYTHLDVYKSQPTLRAAMW